MTKIKCIRNKQRKMQTTSLSFLTFSHPSIFSLFLSLLLGFESTLIRDPRESAWLPVATAKEEKAGGSGGKRVVGDTWSMSFFLTFPCRHLSRQLHINMPHIFTCDGVQYFFGKGGIHRVAMARDRNYGCSHSSAYTQVISRALVKKTEMNEVSF